MDWDWHNNGFFIVFGFVIAIVLINAIASVLKSSQQQQTIREALKSGQSLDPKLFESLSEDSGGSGGTVTGGFVLIAIAAALVILGYFGGGIAGEPDALFGMIGVAAFPALIGVVLVISGLLNRRKQ